MKDPVRNVSHEFVSGLEMVSNKTFALPGAVFSRLGEHDSRLKVSDAKSDDKIAFYEHVVTVRHKPTGRFFVAFRQTIDALMLEQRDPEKYPKWLLDTEAKQAERKVYIYAVRELNGQPVLPARIPGGPRTHEDWLMHISVPWVFDSLAYFLLRNHIISEDMFKKIA